MAAAAAGLTGIGSVMKIVGDQRQAKMDSQMAEYNATVADQNAQQVMAQANENARRSLVNSNKVMGAQQAGFGASGVSGGSVLDVLQDTASKGALDALTIKNEGMVKATAYRNESSLDRYRASNYIDSGNIAAVGDAVGGGSKLAGMGSGGGGS